MTETITYSFKEIGDEIFNQLNTLKTSDGKVGSVFNHDVKIENGISLPAIVITPSNGTVSFLDSCSYENQINFEVRLFDRTVDNYGTIEENMRTVADMMMQKLKNIGTIAWNNSNGKTVKCVFDYERGFTDTQEPLRVFEVVCRFTSVDS